MKKTRRTSRVGESVRDALVQVFRQDLKAINVGFSSITDVEVSPDLHFARVYMSGLKEDETRATVDALQKAKGFIRQALGKRIHLRYTPELDFKYDETTMRASRIEEILMQVMPKQAPAVEPDDADDDENQAGEIEAEASNAETGEDSAPQSQLPREQTEGN